MRGALIVASGTPTPIEGVPPWLSWVLGLAVSSGLLAALVEGIRRALKLPPTPTRPSETESKPTLPLSPPVVAMPQTTDARLDMAARLADKLEEDLEESEARADALELRVAELQGQVVALSNEVESLRAQRAADRESARETIADLRAVIASLTTPRQAP